MIDMAANKKYKDRFRRNLKQFISLKNSGQLNGRANAISKKLKEAAKIAGLNYSQEYSRIESAMERIGSTNDMVRDNPVEVPFTITLKEIDKLHKIRSVKKLNSYVGHKHECYTPRHSGVKPNAHISFHYDPDYTNKVYTLHLLLDGKLEYTACAKGASKSFKTAWKEILNKYGNLEVEIKRQDHAKKVLGAREYAKQEKEYAKKQKKKDDCPDDSKSSKGKKKSTGKKKKPVSKKPGSGSESTRTKKKVTSTDTPATPKEAEVAKKTSQRIDVDAAQKQQAELKEMFQTIMGG